MKLRIEEIAHLAVLDVAVIRSLKRKDAHSIKSDIFFLILVVFNQQLHRYDLILAQRNYIVLRLVQQANAEIFR